MLGKRRVVVAAIGVGAATGLVSLTGLSSASGSAKHHGPPMSTPAVRRYRVDPRLAAHFALFRKARTANLTAPPTEVVASPAAIAFFQLNPSATQLVQTASGPVWVVPGAVGACVMSGQATATTAPQPGKNGTNCDTTDAILKYGLVARLSRRDGSSMLFGIVPDGNASVTLTFATGAAAQQAPVVNNVVKATVPTGSVTVAFRNATGAPTSHQYQGWQP